MTWLKGKTESYVDAVRAKNNYEEWSGVHDVYVCDICQLSRYDWKHFCN